MGRPDAEQHLLPDRDPPPDWGWLADVRSDFAHADIVGRRTVFNIHGNNYRLITRINYRTKRVFILYILTDVEYSKGDWKQ